MKVTLFLPTVAIIVYSQVYAAETVGPHAEGPMVPTLFQTGFEEDDPPKLVRYMEPWWIDYGSGDLSTVAFSGVTDEVAHSGGRSYKMEVDFGDETGGGVLLLLPLNLPRWGDIKVRFHVKVDSDVELWEFHGFLDAQAGEAPSEDAVTNAGIYNNWALPVGEDKGWRIWETTSIRTVDPADYVHGLAIRFRIRGKPPATRVTVYLDDVTVTGDLPEDYETNWPGVYREAVEQRDREQAEIDSRRRAGLKKALDKVRSEFRPAEPDSLGGGVITRRYAALCETIKNLIAKVEESMGQTGDDSAILDQVERVVSHLNTYTNAMMNYPKYGRSFGNEDVVTYVLEPTQSYAILPGGPFGHNEAIPHYTWGGEGFENPQLLPDVEAVPAAPSRRMEAFGCRGTYVPTSFAVAPETEWKDVIVEASDLKNGSHTIERDAVDVRVVAAWYRKKKQLLNDFLLHDPNFVVPDLEKEENVFADEKFGSDAETLQPVTIAPGTLRQFYVTTKVPDDAPAGMYSGILTVKPANGAPIALSLAIEVLPFDLDPTPYAYSFFYRTGLVSDEAKKERGVHDREKSPAQMQAELINMAEHGCNTLNLYGGRPKKTDKGWDFSELNRNLAMAKKAGLTRSPFTWLGHGVPFLPSPDREGAPKDIEEVVARINKFIPAVNEFCDSNGFPRPALFGHDEKRGQELIDLTRGYAAVNEAGGIVTVACYTTFFDEVGGALSLPIIYGGAREKHGRKAMLAAQALGHETWIYNCPATNMPASPSVYRRRYGLGMWRNGEQGAAPWAYQGLPYCMAYPTWNGKPIDTIIYEAFREGVYDTRYMATLERRLRCAKQSGASSDLTGRIERWLESFSINDDLHQIRRQIVDYVAALAETSPDDP
jgi:hypothetical protein